MSDKLPITVYCSNQNGAEWLEESLTALDCCDQRIFLDDNSTDKSVKIAENHGWEIYHWKGMNSMSERRNYSIHFTGNEEYTPEFAKDPELMKNIPPEPKHEWIIQLDSDEVWSENTKRELQGFLGDKRESKYANTVAFPLYNEKQGGGFMGHIPLPRMFRKGTIWWEKKIQNTTQFKQPVASRNILIRHYGYANPQYQWIKQWSRLPLLEEDVRDHPDDFDRRVYLANVLSLVSGEGDSWERLFAQASVAINAFLERKDLQKSSGAKVALQKVMRFVFNSCNRRDDISAFVVLMNQVWDFVEFHPDPWYWMLLVHRNTGNYGKVIEYGEGYFKAMHKHEISRRIVEVTTGDRMHEVAEVLQATYQGLAQRMQGKEKKKYERRGAIWAKKKLEYWDHAGMIKEK